MKSKKPPFFPKSLSVVMQHQALRLYSDPPTAINGEWFHRHLGRLLFECEGIWKNSKCSAETQARIFEAAALTLTEWPFADERPKSEIITDIDEILKLAKKLSALLKRGGNFGYLSGRKGEHSEVMLHLLKGLVFAETNTNKIKKSIKDLPRSLNKTKKETQFRNFLIDGIYSRCGFKGRGKNALIDTIADLVTVLSETETSSEYVTYRVNRT